MNSSEEYDPSVYEDSDLIDVFWTINKKKYPERYSEIMKELENRGLEYEDLPHSERSVKKQEEDGAADNFIIKVYFLAAGILFSVVGYFYNLITV